MPNLKLTGPSDWATALRELDKPTSPRYMIVNAKNGLGNRLRALASAMAVAASVGRPVLLIWVPDLHCNCSFRSLFKAPLPFALLEEEFPHLQLQMRADTFRMYNYMRPEPGAIKDERVWNDPQMHTYFKSGFLMNHSVGDWKYAYWYLQLLTPVDRVERMLVTDRTMLGLHVRNIFDAPRDASSAKLTVGTSAIDGAQKEYGKEGTEQLLKWRQASHWSNFVDRMVRELEEYKRNAAAGDPPLKFYLAADSEEAYAGLMSRFNSTLVVTRRNCASTRCDFRDCDSLIYSLVDMLNLARTRLILGSGYSSYSEVAAWMGAYAPRRFDRVHPLRLEMAGRDFGKELLPTKASRLVNPSTRSSMRCPAWEDVLNTPKDSRWVIWDAGGGGRGRSCPSGCVLHGCQKGRFAPCCVKRMSATWPIGCALMPYGCPRNISGPISDPDDRVVDTLVVPKVVPTDTCPTREDVLNTNEKERWSMWGDGACSKSCTGTRCDGCAFSQCNGGRTAPCCVKRLEPTWPMECRFLPAGCFDPDTTELLVRDKRAEEEVHRTEWMTVTDSVPSLSPSHLCPSREDVMNTPSSVRWSLWEDDKQCESGCALVHCKRGRAAPCCVKRMKAEWSVSCRRLEHGCFRRFSSWWWRGRIVQDRRKFFTYNREPEVLVIAVLLAVLGLCALLWTERCRQRVARFALQALRVAEMCAQRAVRFVRRHVTLEVRQQILSRPSDTKLFFGALLLGCLFVYTQTSTEPDMIIVREAIVDAQPLLAAEAPVTAVPAVVTSTPAQAPCETVEDDLPVDPDPVEDDDAEGRPTVGALADEKFRAPRWFVEGEREKAGAGLLFFAYGAHKTLNHFLLEAEKAGRTFRDHNPGIQIAVVTNNATVNQYVFDHHIMPRMDLMFPGDTDNGGQGRGDNLPRQWLTRLFYMAHTPFELTWALDSNVLSCTPGAAQVFLEAAFISKLWGYHIAHASQNVMGRGDADVMYPHNFNIMFQWSEQTSALMREWFLVTMRNGVASDDQKTLHIAELRLTYRSGLNVGKIAPTYGAAFQNAYSNANGTTRLRSDKTRLTPVLQGRVHILHTTNPAMCDTFNQHPALDRQMLMRTMGKVKEGRYYRSIFRYDSLQTYEQCSEIMGPDSRYCLLDTAMVYASTESAGRAWVSTDDNKMNPVVPNEYVKPVVMEDYQSYALSKRCGPMCTEFLPSDSLGKFNLKLVQNDLDFRRSTPCMSSRIVPLHHLALHEPACPSGDLLRGLTFTRRGCPVVVRSRGVTRPERHWMHFAFRCVHNAPEGVETMVMDRWTSCGPVRYAALIHLTPHNITCPDGFALASFFLAHEKEGCEKDTMRFRFRCSAILTSDYLMPGRDTADHERDKNYTLALLEAEREQQKLAGGEVHGSLPVRPRFEASTTCRPGAASINMIYLEQHPMSCPATHALQGFRLVLCEDANEIRMEYVCVPVRVGTPVRTYPAPRLGKARLRDRQKK